MRRYRMISPVRTGHWRATKEMARQDAIPAGFGYRDPVTGLATVDPGIRLEIAEGDAEPTDADLLEGDALAVLVVHGRQAETFAKGQFAVSLDAGERQRWRAILKALEALKQEIATGNNPAIK